MHAVIDTCHPAYETTLPKPLGVLPVPAQVAENVMKECSRIEKEHGFTITDDAKSRMLQDGTLDWYYRDQFVAYRITPHGVEVLAVGEQQVFDFLRTQPPEVRSTISTMTV